MSEQKVWVEKMPEYCDECLCSLRGKDDCAYCNLLHKNIGYDFGKRPKHCLLINIKDHDRELVRQVCEKIRDYLLDKCEFDYGYYINDGDFSVPDLWYFLDQIQKDIENG